MTDDNTDVPVVSDVVDTVDDVVPDPVEDTADDTLEGMPPWGQHIIDRLDELTNKVDNIAPTPEEVTDPVVPDKDETPDEPDHGEPVRDESPVALPWTHRNPFKH